MQNNSTYSIVTLENTPTEQIYDTTKAAFSNYFVPIRTSYKEMLEKNRAAGVDYKKSVGAVLANDLVGLILCAYDYHEGYRAVYNAGTCVLESHRGKGIASQMQQKMIEIAAKIYQAERIYLEVITENSNAISLYEKYGFTTKRLLESYIIKSRLHSINTPQGITIGQSVFNKESVNKSFWDFNPAWKNDSKVIEKRNDLHTVNAIYNNETIGYLVYSKYEGEIIQIAVNPQYKRQGVGKALLKFADNQLSDNIFLKFINVDFNDPGINLFLKSLGFQHYVTQKEMILDLK